MKNSEKDMNSEKNLLLLRLKNLRDERKKTLEELRELQERCSHENVLWVYVDDEYGRNRIYACPDCFLYERGYLRVFESFKDVKGKPKNRFSAQEYFAPYKDRLSALIEHCKEIVK